MLRVINPSDISFQHLPLLHTLSVNTERIAHSLTVLFCRVPRKANTVKLLNAISKNGRVLIISVIVLIVQ